MKRRFKIRYKRLFIFLGAIALLTLVIIKIYNLKISNIYIDGNEFLSDQQIIEIGGIENYPKAILTLSNNLENKLEKDEFIKKAKVTKKKLTKLYINVEENKPLLYDDVNKKTVLEDGVSVSKTYDVPILVNTVSNDIYEKFIDKLRNIKKEVKNNISEIEYTPNDVDKELFMFSMKDGNYISVNLNKFSSVDRYLEIVKKFNNKKGILYLDSGEYFKILSN